MPAHTLESLPFDNQFARLGPEFYSRVPPTPFDDWQLAHFNPGAASLIELRPGEEQREQFTRYFTGMQPWPGSDPLAALYAGHQFGMWVPQLGDGRAILLGQVCNSTGELWDLQLKGCGPTPYSRFADGRAVLRSTIREYLGSEAMHGLGIPTTRALALFHSGQKIRRERLEPAAALVRMAQSHIRFGSFEVFFSRDQGELTRQLADHVIAGFYPDAAGADNPYAALFAAVVERTADLMALWQAVGFAHGVMNTDNMSVLGLTIDYGPFGFMEAYDPDWICNHSDSGGRYAFNRQPQIALWNLACFGNTLLEFVPVQRAQAILEEFTPRYEQSWRRAMAEKLGLDDWRKDDPGLIGDLLELLAKDRVDYPIFFRRLGETDPQQPRSVEQLRDLFLHREQFDRWWRRYRTRLARQDATFAERRERMRRVNPKYVLRNYMAQIAIERAEQGDFSEVDRLLRIVQAPFDEHPDAEAYAGHPPSWATGIEVSCSS